MRLPFHTKNHRKEQKTMMKAMEKDRKHEKPGENSKENDGLSEESRADGQQKRMNHHMIRKG